jgi:hypothetical protein
MATHTLLSPPAISPRKALQNLPTNIPKTPKDKSSKLVQYASPFKSNVSPTPSTLFVLKDQIQTHAYALNASRKRVFDEVVAVDERGSSQKQPSFSSMINYDPPSTSPVSLAPTISSHGETIKIVSPIRVSAPVNACP